MQTRMALFEKVQRLSSECHQQLINFYEQQGDFFPMELRNIYTPHMEATLCGGELDEGNPSHFGDIVAFIGGVVQRLEEHLDATDAKQQQLPFFIRHKLTTALQQLKVRGEGEAVVLFGRMKECLRYEMELVQRAEAVSVVMQQPDILMDNLNYVKKRVEATGDLLKRMVAEQSAFEILVTEKQHLENHLTSIQTVNADEQTRNLELSIRQGIAHKSSAVDANLRQMMTLRDDFFQGIRENIKNLGDLQAQILRDHLFVWKYQQQKAANGLAAMKPISLDKVQVYLENLAEMMWRTRQQVLETERLKPRNPVFNDNQCDTSMLLEDLLVLLTTLLNESFIIEDQPQQVMKKGNKFTNAPKVSLLLGNLNIQMNPPQVSTCIIREGQAKTLSVTEKVDVAMPITNDKTNLEFNPTTRRLTAKFLNLQLREIKRADRKNTGSSCAESVMEEKLSMLFESWLQVGDVKIRVRTLSLPVVVTSHGSQDPTAEATIMWDNAFGSMGRIPFQVPNRVPWNEVAQVMSAKFLTMTGRALTEDNLRFLKQKAFRSGSHSEWITWNEFAKDHLPNYNFSFWHWVYAALKNIERKDYYLKDLWKEGHLVGFVEREGAASLLRYREPGTFMLRFSDSKAGAITISVVNEDRSVICIAPMDENELKLKRLANSIRDLEQLKLLYPGIPKDDAFGKYYTASDTISTPDKPYVPILPSIPDGNNRRYSGSGGSIANQMSPPAFPLPHTPDPVDNQSMMGSQGSFYNHQNQDDYSFSEFVDPTQPLSPSLPSLLPLQSQVSFDLEDILMAEEYAHQDLIQILPNPTTTTDDQSTTWTNDTSFHHLHL